MSIKVKMTLDQMRQVILKYGGYEMRQHDSEEIFIVEAESIIEEVSPAERLAKFMNDNKKAWGNTNYEWRDLCDSSKSGWIKLAQDLINLGFDVNNMPEEKS